MSVCDDVPSGPDASLTTEGEDHLGMKCGGEVKVLDFTNNDLKKSKSFLMVTASVGAKLEAEVPIGSLLGLGLAVNGFLPGMRLAGTLQLGGGMALMAWAFWDVGRRSKRTRYHRWPWTRLDRVVMLLGLIGALGWLAIMIAQPQWLHYYPYAPYSPWPVFNPLPGGILLLLALPGALLRQPYQESEVATPA